MSSARSIPAAVNPPRAVYLDYPLGHTAGKANDAENQMSIMRDTLEAFERMTAPGTIVDLPYTWRADFDWKDGVMRPKAKTAAQTDKQANHADDRVERYDTPQYQTAEDAAVADPLCASCVFLGA